MPNECWNILRIVGHIEDLDVFEEKELKFESFFPTSKEYDWYAWATDNWGTKWERTNYSVVERSPHELIVHFTTAWNAPLRFFEKLLELYPRCWIKLSYDTEGGEGGVWVSWMKGGLVQVSEAHWIAPEPRLTVNGEILVPDLVHEFIS